MLRLAPVVLALTTLSIHLHAETWPQFRGPAGTGIAAAGAVPPAEFSPTKRMLWKVALQPGHSSPVVWGERIFLTSADEARNTLETVCLSTKDGAVLWRHAVTPAELEYRFSVNGYASPTPAVDAERVYVYFGSYGLLALDHSGKQQWELKLPLPQALFGTGTSPILAGEHIVLHRDEASGGYLLAIHRRTGKEVWKTAYNQQQNTGFSKSTPILWKDQIVVHRGGSVDAYAAATGKRAWWVEASTTGTSSLAAAPEAVFAAAWSPYGEADQRAPVPTFDELVKQHDKNGDGQLAFEEIGLRPMVLRPEVPGTIEGVEVRLNAYRGRIDANRDGSVSREEWTAITQWFAERARAEHGMVAIRPAGAGEMTGQVAWRVPTAIPEVPSPLYYDGRVYMVRNGGIVTAIEAKSGKLLYRARLGAPGPYYSSPIVAGGLLYVASGEGIVSVWKPGETLQVIARNDIGEPIFATPAPVERRLYVRTENALYAFGDQ